MSRPKRPILIKGQWGLGDNIYARPFVKNLCESREVWLDTPWPEIYEDLPVYFVHKPRKLRTQMKNVKRQTDDRWTPLPKLWMDSLEISYLGVGRQHLSIPVGIGLSFGGASADWPNWDLPAAKGSPIVSSNYPVAVVKVTTIRKEWKSQSRNPKPEYVNWIASKLLKTHVVVAVADIDGNEETIVGDMPPHNLAFIQGELVVEDLIGLVRNADIVIGGVGWNVPMSIALKTRSFVILGGRGAHNAPEIITDPRMDLSRIGYAKPRQYCRCSIAQHDCNKDIPDLAEQWENYCKRVGLVTRSGALLGGASALATIQ